MKATKAPQLVVPPRKYDSLPGKFSWGIPATLASTRDADLLPLGQLADDLRRLGIPSRIVRDAVSECSLRVLRDPAVKGDEAYRLEVTPSAVTVRASADAGAYYGLQTVRELLHAQGRALACCRIQDSPDFARRAQYYDCSRGKVPTLESLKEVIELLAHWKVNEIQLYVENVFVYQRHPAIGKGFSPFTAEDLLELQAFAALHHMRFVPSLASFGHMETILALPEYRPLSELENPEGKPGGTTLCPVDPGSIRLMGELYDEFLPLFTATDFNACGDEPWELGKGRSKRACERYGTGEVYSGFIRKLHRLAEKHGKRLNLWADIVLQHPECLTKLPKDMAMLNWDYYPQGYRIRRSHEITDAGYALVACPGSNSWQSHGTRMQIATDNVTIFAAEARRRNAEGILMTDWGDCGHRQPRGVSYRSFAHAAAQAWNGRAVDNAKFSRVFCRDLMQREVDGLAGALDLSGSLAMLDGSGYKLYHALVSPVSPKRADFSVPRISPVWNNNYKAIEQADGPGCRTLLEKAEALAFPLPGYRDTPAAKTFLSGLALAKEMDVVAARRVLLGKAYRAGESVTKEEWASLGDAAKRMNVHFERLWNQENRPSRLADNMRRLDSAAKECFDLARKA